MFKKSSLVKFIAFNLIAVCILSSCKSNKTPAETNATDTTVDAAPVESNSTDTTYGDGTQNQTTHPAWKNPDDGSLILMSDNTPYFTIMRAEKCSETALQCILDMNDKIKELAGRPFGIKTDFVKSGESLDEETPLMIIGATAYKDSADALAALEKNQYSITTKDNHIIIAAENDFILQYAIESFLNEFMMILKDDSGNITLSVPDGISYISEPVKYSPLAFLRDSERFKSTSEHLYTVPYPDSNIKTAQGGYSDGKYFYQAFIKKDTASNEANNVVRIVKSDAVTGEVIKVSGDLALNHANDITYNPKLGALLVVHNNPNRTWVTLINPDTLEVIRTVTLPLSIYCMSYNEERDMYVVGVSGGQNFMFLDADFKMVGKVKIATTKTAGYTTQGMSSDDDFIYFVLYKENVITVYDWDGKFVTIIELDVGSIEPENMSVVDGEIFVTCYTSSGAKVFKITPKKNTD